LSAFPRRTFLAILGVYLVLAVPGIWRSHFWGDEGWYALAARSVLEGQKPYRDFAFFQMPLVAYVYGAWFRIAGPSIEAARALSVVLGAVGLAFAMGAAWRLSGALAMGAAGITLALNGSYILQTIQFKTQPLTVALVSATAFALAGCDARAGAGRLFACAALGWATVLARLSLLPLPLALLPALVWMRRDRKPVAIAAWAGATALFLSLIAWFHEDGAMWFHVYSSHQQMAEHPWTAERFYYFWRTFVLEQFPLVALMVLGCIGLAWSMRHAGRRDGLEPLAVLLAAYAACFVLHAMNRSSYAAHQVSTMTLAALIAGVAAARVTENEWLPSALAVVALLHLSAAGLLFGETIQRLNEAAELVRQHSSPGDAILTLNGELAVQAGRRTLPGYGMNEFSVFPKMSEEDAQRFHLTTPARVLADIASRKAALLCAGDREFAKMSGNDRALAERFHHAIESNYELVGKVEKFGQFQQTLKVLKVRGR
jgi:hypothetical protein